MTGDERVRLVLGVDPGETTGLAKVRFDLDAGTATLQSWWAPPWQEASYIVRHQLDNYVNECAVERYMVNAKSASKGQEPIEAAIGMVGVCRHYCEKSGVVMRLESASAAKNVATDEALKNLDLWTTNRHSRDAVRQCVLMAVKRHWISPAALL